MDKNQYLTPLEQLIEVNKTLISIGDQFSSPVITVGGQAVWYWVLYNQRNYESPPLEEYITSTDLDYSAKKIDVQTIARILNVKAQYNDVGGPPSIAIFTLIDKDSGHIKTAHGKSFINTELLEDNNEIEANSVDIIDWPAGFTGHDFKKDIELHSELFQIEINDNLPPLSHPNVRILNPIACLRSRLANIHLHIKGNVKVEVERSKALLVPIYTFLLERARWEPNVFHCHVSQLASLAQHRDYKQYLVKYDIKLHNLLKALVEHIGSDREKYDIHDKFLAIGLPQTIINMQNSYNRKLEQLENRHNLSNK